jgi:hypothetical protein
MLEGGMRVCDACRADRFVSNAALYAECGVDFWRELPRLAAAGVFFHTADVHLDTVLNRCSLSAHDRMAAAAAVARRETPTLVFFWRPHLEAVLGPLADLATLARCPDRAAAGGRLRGFARALFTRLAIAQGGKPIRVTTSHLFYMSEPGQRRERDLVGLHGSTSFVHYPSEIGKGNATRERARIAVQAAFLAHAGRSTLPRVRGRGRRRATVAQLRLLEVRRATAAPWYPQFSVAPAFELRHLFNQACASVQEPFRAPGAGREAAVEYIEVSDD